MTTNRKRKGRRGFGATRQLPSGRWQASYRAPDGKRRAAESTFATAASRFVQSLWGAKSIFITENGCAASTSLPTTGRCTTPTA